MFKRTRKHEILSLRNQYDYNNENAFSEIKKMKVINKIPQNEAALND